jgi:hypothetical protein
MQTEVLRVSLRLSPGADSWSLGASRTGARTPKRQ